MTRPAGTPRKKPEPRRRKTNGDPPEHRSPQSHGRLASLTLSPPTLRNDVNMIPADTAWPTPPDSATRSSHPAPNPARSFFLGSTSYAAVFTEQQPLPDTVHEQPSESLSVTPSSSSRSIGNRHCQFSLGTSIVSAFTPFSFIEKCVKMYFENHIAAALIAPLIISLLPQLRNDIEQLTAAADNNAHHLYVEMTKNTARPLKVPSTMLPSEFHTLVTGKNLRWETLGLILAVTASNAQYTSPNDSIFTLADGRRLDKDRVIEDIIHATNDCINISQIHGAVNDSKYSMLREPGREI